MEKYGLIGRPLGHSFSAGYFAEKFSREGIDAEYANYPLPDVEHHLLPLIEANDDLRGLNVTIPYKQDVIPFLDDISPDARAIGAVNVIAIKRVEGRPRLKGFNSDVIGFKRSLQPLLKPHHRRALVLGTGGASKAVVYGLRSLGIEPTYVSRTSREGVLSYDELTLQTVADNLLIVNCTPLGMFPNVETRPAIPYECLTPRHLLYDLVYNPTETAFLAAGRDRGCTTKNGLEMLHIQAEASWEFWHEV